MKKLIEKRNDRFQSAVDEYEGYLLGSLRSVVNRALSRLILACQTMETPEDPVALVQKAAKDHVPLDPTHPTQQPSTSSHNFLSTDSRQSVEEVIAEIEGAEEYRDQIVFRKIFDIKEPRYGSSPAFSTVEGPNDLADGRRS